jgi:hypothetical protein
LPGSSTIYASPSKSYGSARDGCFLSARRLLPAN